MPFAPAIPSTAVRMNSGEKLNRYLDLPSHISRKINRPSTPIRTNVIKSVSRLSIAPKPESAIIKMINHKNIQL